MVSESRLTSAIACGACSICCYFSNLGNTIFSVTIPKDWTVYQISGRLVGITYECFQWVFFVVEYSSRFNVICSSVIDEYIHTAV